MQTLSYRCYRTAVVPCSLDEDCRSMVTRCWRTATRGSRFSECENHGASQGRRCGPVEVTLVREGHHTTSWARARRLSPLLAPNIQERVLLKAERAEVMNVVRALLAMVVVMMTESLSESYPWPGECGGCGAMQ